MDGIEFIWSLIRWKITTDLKSLCLQLRYNWRTDYSHLCPRGHMLLCSFQFTGISLIRARHKMLYDFVLLDFRSLSLPCETYLCLYVINLFILIGILSLASIWRFDLIIYSFVYLSKVYKKFVYHEMTLFEAILLWSSYVRELNQMYLFIVFTFLRFLFYVTQFR